METLWQIPSEQLLGKPPGPRGGPEKELAESWQACPGRKTALEDGLPIQMSEENSTNQAKCEAENKYAGSRSVLPGEQTSRPVRLEPASQTPQSQ